MRHPLGKLWCRDTAFHPHRHLNGSRLTSPKPFGWPAHGYAEFAEWDASTGTLTLKGWPVVESKRGLQLIATAAESLFVLDGESFQAMGGPSRTVFNTSR